MNGRAAMRPRDLGRIIGAAALARADLAKYACEFIGTFALVFFAAAAVVLQGRIGGLGPIAAGLTSGGMVAIVIATFGSISGAHINPALSLAACWLGFLEKRLLPGYILAQLAGSALAGLLLLLTIGTANNAGANLPNIAAGVTVGEALVIETLLSFIMMWVICGAGFDPRANPAAAPFAIGATVGIEVMLFGPYAGASMNPARAFGPMMALGDFSHFWIYVAGPVVGVMLGAAAWRFTHAAEAT
jgi:MIP family channel proteins